jgi:hypothetical protein
LNKKQYQRLEPFLHRKSARQRVILYLIAQGYTFNELIAMTVRALRAMELPVEMQVYRDDMLNGHKSGPAFLYPSGNPLRATDYRRLVQESAGKVLGRPMSRAAFRAYINSPSK